MANSPASVLRDWGRFHRAREAAPHMAWALQNNYRLRFPGSVRDKAPPGQLHFEPGGEFFGTSLGIISACPVITAALAPQPSAKQA